MFFRPGMMSLPPCHFSGSTFPQRLSVGPTLGWSWPFFFRPQRFCPANVLLECLVFFRFPIHFCCFRFPMDPAPWSCWPSWPTRLLKLEQDHNIEVPVF